MIIDDLKTRVLFEKPATLDEYVRRAQYIRGMSSNNDAQFNKETLELAMLRRINSNTFRPIVLIAQNSDILTWKLPKVFSKTKVYRHLRANFPSMRVHDRGNHVSFSVQDEALIWMLFGD